MLKKYKVCKQQYWIIQQNSQNSLLSTWDVTPAKELDFKANLRVFTYKKWHGAIFLETILWNYTTPLLCSSFRQTVVARWLLKTSSSFGSLEIIMEREKKKTLSSSPASSSWDKAPIWPCLVAHSMKEDEHCWTSQAGGETVAKLWLKWKFILWETAGK